MSSNKTLPHEVFFYYNVSLLKGMAMTNFEEMFDGSDVYQWDDYDSTAADQWHELVTLRIENYLEEHPDDFHLMADYLRSIQDGTDLSKSLKCIGDVLHEPSKKDRADLLVEFLQSNIPRVRNGAIIGLSLMKDKRTLPFIEKASEKEKVRLLKSMLEELVRYINKYGDNND